MKNMSRPIVLLAALAMATLLLSACSTSTTSSTAPAPTPNPAQTPATGGVTVSEVNFAFSPTSVMTQVGSKVTWVNNDSVPHDVKIDGQDLGQQVPGASVTWTPTKAGTYPYVCTIHSQMKGQIVVQ